MGIKQLYNDDLRKLPNKYGDVSVMLKKMHHRHIPKREKQVTDHSTGDKNYSHDFVYLHYSFNCNFFSYNSK